ncbi:MAG: hypothetical protein SOW10_03405, partial [Alloprevotella sp.]|nr:hypothetical protein [Alloprevotella sp.]
SSKSLSLKILEDSGVFDTNIIKTDEKRKGQGDERLWYDFFTAFRALHDAGCIALCVLPS